MSTEDLKYIGRILLEQNQQLQSMVQQKAEQNVLLASIRSGLEWAVAAAITCSVAVAISTAIAILHRSSQHEATMVVLRGQQQELRALRLDLRDERRRSALQAVALSAVIRAGAPEGIQGERARQRAVAAELAALQALPRTAARDREIGALRSELVPEPATQDLLP